MHEIFAIRYASFAGRQAHENFIVRDMHDGPMPLDYYVWVVRQGSRVALVDTGFNRDAGRQRNRELSIAPELALERLGIDPKAVTDVILTHLHYDHAGNLDKFPNARFHVQVREMSYATGPCMCHGFFRHPFDAEPVVQMVRYLYGGRVVFHDGSQTIHPGLDVCRVGGHSDGLQVVRVETDRGPVVLASDALHFYDNMRRQNPFPLVYSIGDMIAGWATVERLAGDSARIIAGHDPLVAQLYPRLRGSDIDVFALHEPPLPQLQDDQLLHRPQDRLEET